MLSFCLLFVAIIGIDDTFPPIFEPHPHPERLIEEYERIRDRDVPKDDNGRPISFEIIIEEPDPFDIPLSWS